MVKKNPKNTMETWDNMQRSYRGQESTTSMMNLGRVDGNVWGMSSEYRKKTSLCFVKMETLRPEGSLKTQRNVEKNNRKKSVEIGKTWN